MKKILSTLFTKIWSDSAKLNNEILTSYIQKSPKAKILDIGVFRAELIIERVKNIKTPQIYAVDIDPKAIASCKKLGIKATKYNIEKGLPYKSNYFDIVSANQIIEHLVDVDLFISEIHRVLKPKGYLVISTENLSSWHNIFAIILGWQAFSQHISYKKNIGNPFKLGHSHSDNLPGVHIKIFTLRGLREITELYGFKVKKTFGAGYYPFWGKISQALSSINPSHSAFIGLKAQKIK